MKKTINLQNIPIRSELGREIRKGFVATAPLPASDYSQIERRMASPYRSPVKQPCNDCPFRRASMPGWLGAGSPESFLDCLQRDEPLPCHQTVDYEDPLWAEKWSAQEVGSMCAGALVFMANKMQRPRSREFPTMPPDKVVVFANSVEFVRHHREAAVRSWEDVDQNEGAQLQRELVKRAAENAGSPIVDYKNKRR
jgi:hypothetical protein